MKAKGNNKKKLLEKNFCRQREAFNSIFNREIIQISRIDKVFSYKFNV